MKSIPSLRAAVLASAMLLTSAALIAGPSPASDAASERLAAAGTISVKSVGQYVEQGTLRIQVSTKLGRPTTILSDGTWLYDNRKVIESEASGTLVVRFQKGRVSDLSLVTPAVAVAMKAKPVGSDLVATK